MNGYKLEGVQDTSAGQHTDKSCESSEQKMFSQRPEHATPFMPRLWLTVRLFRIACLLYSKCSDNVPGEMCAYTNFTVQKLLPQRTRDLATYDELHIMQEVVCAWLVIYCPLIVLFSAYCSNCDIDSKKVKWTKRLFDTGKLSLRLRYFSIDICHSWCYSTLKSIIMTPYTFLWFIICSFSLRLHQTNRNEHSKIPY